MNPDLPTLGSATLRDYFAAEALVGLLASRNRASATFDAAAAAREAYEHADAMLAEREKGQ